MDPKLLTEHAQMHAGKYERLKVRTLSGKGNLGNGKGGELKQINKFPSA